jgi:hypothetical protein
MGTHTDNIKAFNKTLGGGSFPIPDQGGIYTKGGTQPPKRKVGRGAKGAKHDFASTSQSGANKPRCPSEWDTYEAIYSKSGSLTEAKKKKPEDETDKKPADKKPADKKDGRPWKKVKESTNEFERILAGNDHPYKLLKEAFDSVKTGSPLREMAGQFPELEDDDFIPDGEYEEDGFDELTSDDDLPPIELDDEEDIPDEEFDDLDKADEAFSDDYDPEDEEDPEFSLDDDEETRSEITGETWEDEDEEDGGLGEFSADEDFDEDDIDEEDDFDLEGDGELDLDDTDSFEALADEEVGDDDGDDWEDWN